METISTSLVHNVVITKSKFGKPKQIRKFRKIRLVLAQRSEGFP